MVFLLITMILGFFLDGFFPVEGMDLLASRDGGGGLPLCRGKPASRGRSSRVGFDTGAADGGAAAGDLVRVQGRVSLLPRFEVPLQGGGGGLSVWWSRRVT
jgi:hypothetical protein